MRFDGYVAITPRRNTAATTPTSPTGIAAVVARGTERQLPYAYSAAAGTTPSVYARNHTSGSSTKNSVPRASPIATPPTSRPTSPKADSADLTAAPDVREIRGDRHRDDEEVRELPAESRDRHDERLDRGENRRDTDEAAAESADGPSSHRRIVHAVQAEREEWNDEGEEVRQQPLRAGVRQVEGVDRDVHEEHAERDEPDHARTEREVLEGDPSDPAHLTEPARVRVVRRH